MLCKMDLLCKWIAYGKFAVSNVHTRHGKILRIQIYDFLFGRWIHLCACACAYVNACASMLAFFMCLCMTFRWWSPSETFGTSPMVIFVDEHVFFLLSLLCLRLWRNQGKKKRRKYDQQETIYVHVFCQYVSPYVWAPTFNGNDINVNFISLNIISILFSLQFLFLSDNGLQWIPKSNVKTAFFCTFSWFENDVVAFYRFYRIWNVFVDNKASWTLKYEFQISKIKQK